MVRFLPATALARSLSLLGGLLATSQQGCATGASVCVPTYAVINGAVPEPGSWLLVLLVLLSLGAAGWASRRPAGLAAAGPRCAAA